MRSVIDTIIPDGSAWAVAPGEDLDKLYDGIAENWEEIRLFLADLENTRNPTFTPFLSDLEREFGVLTNPNLTETQRRTQLKPIVYNRASNGSIDAMQQALDDAGFSVSVHSNDPAVDPALFVTTDDLIVNGDIFKQTLIFTTLCGKPDSLCGRPEALCGANSGIQRDPILYVVPPNSDDWPLVFFVGGDATRDGGGFLTNINTANVPAEQESQFKRIILKYKPIHSWAGLVVTYV